MKMNDQIIELIQGEMNQEGNSIIKTQKHEIKMHSVFFDEEISNPSKYRELIHTLLMSSEHDQFIFMINSPGGYLSSALAIIETMKSSEALIRANLFGECHSAASMIALNCDEIMVSDSATMLVHTASYGTEGQSGNVRAHVDFSSKRIKSIIEDTYSGFMTSNEIADLHKGMEFWFDSKEIGKRLINRLKYKESKLKKPAKKQKEVVAEQS